MYFDDERKSTEIDFKQLMYPCFKEINKNANICLVLQYVNRLLNNGTK